MLCAVDVEAAIGFYTSTFDATETGLRVIDPDGRVAHAELEMGGTTIWLVSEYPEFEIEAPQAAGRPVQFVLHVDDVDTIFERATSRGATIAYPISEKPHGERSGRLDDPFGYRWSVRTRSGAANSGERSANETKRTGSQSVPGAAKGRLR